MHLPALLLSSLLPLLSGVTAINQITRTGKYLYEPDGSRFYIRGVAYQPQGEVSAQTEANDANGGFPEPSSYIDPLSSPANCTRDLPYLQQLNANAIRVYSVNPENNHDECMKTFSDAGIYVLLDISLPLNGSINRASPAWTTSLLDEYIRTMEAFEKYDNVLAFNVGNEVVTLPVNTDAAPYVKAAARDVKAYLASKGSNVLVGYSSVDGSPDFRDPLANYLTCGNDSVALDIYGLNNYEWCGSRTFASSGWEAIVNDLSDLPVAAYMSEYGCITSPPRLWQEVGSLYSEPTTDVFSGGIAFSYFPTSDGYGMVTFSGNDGNTVDVSDDFTRLANQLSNVTSTPNTPAQSSVTVTEGACPAENSTFLASTDLPPTPNEAICNCLYDNSFTCVVTSAASQNPAILGSLLDYTCSLLGSTGAAANCANIGGNGTSGTYGPVAYCSDAVKLSYAFSAYYESQNRNSQACDFAGNATIVRNAPNTAQDASDAASQCLAQAPSGGVFTVTAAGGTETQTATGTGSQIGSATRTASQTGSTAAATSTGAAMSDMKVAVGAGALQTGLAMLMGVGAGAMLLL